MKYIFKNIRSFAENETAIFALVLVCVLLSAFLMNFSYGLYRNYDEEYKNSLEDLSDLILKPADDVGITRAEMEAFLLAIPEESMEKIALIYIPIDDLQISADLADAGDEERYAKLSEGSYEENGRAGFVYYRSFAVRFAVRDGEFVRSPMLEEIEKKQGSVKKGRALDDNDERNGLYNALINDNIKDIDVGDEITFMGNRYSVVGRYVPFDNAPIVPFRSLPDDTVFNSVCWFTTCKDMILTRPIYNDIKKAADRTIPDKLVFPELALPDDDTLALFRNIVLISVLIAGSTVMSFALLYLFVMRKRKRSLAVLQICGATRSKAAGIYLGECLALTVPTFGLGTLVFDIILKNVFSKIFNYMRDFFTPITYLCVFGAYILIMLLIIGAMVVKNVRVSLKDTLTEGRI